MTGCDEEQPVPTEPTAEAPTAHAPNADLEAQIHRLLNSLFPAGTQRAEVNSLFDQIKDANEDGDLEIARDRMFELVDIVLTAGQADELEDSRDSQTADEGAVELTQLLFEFVGLESPPLTTAVFSESGGADVVDESGGTVTTSDGKGAVDVPQDAFSETTVLTIERLEDPDTKGEGPLPTNLDQFPPFYDVSSTTSPSADVTVEVCVVAPSDPLGPDPAVADELVVGHEPSDDPGQIELLPSVPAQALDCADQETAVAGTTDSFSGVNAVNPGTTWKEAVAMGNAHTCAVATDDTPYCWGANSDGQLGDGSTSESTSPVPVDVTGIAPSTFSQLAGGGAHTCALDPAGKPYCWGHNGFGQLGIASTGGGNLTPRPVDLSGITASSFVQITASSAHTCVLTSGGQAYCWGDNRSGQVGNGSTADVENEPQPVDQNVDGGISFTEISAGFGTTCGVTSSGQAYCWGGNIGDGTRTGSHVPAPVDQSADGGFSLSAISASFHSCGLTPAGQGYCWGFNLRGGLGNGESGTDAHRQSPVAVVQSGVTGGSFDEVAVGFQHTCGLASGQAYCWGLGSSGEIGDGTTEVESTPQAVTQSFEGGITFTTIAVPSGGRHTCGVTQADQLFCWGENSSGQLGDGTTDDGLTPVPVEDP